MPHLTSIELMGIEKGRQEGRQEGQCRIVERQLERRVGKLLPPVEQRLRTLSSQQLELLAEALLDFRSAADLDTWLTER
jgi:predicted transposase YdaD